MAYLEAETCHLPIPGHYDCGYGYGYGFSPNHHLTHDSRTLHRASQPIPRFEYNLAFIPEELQFHVARSRPRTPPYEIPPLTLGPRRDSSFKAGYVPPHYRPQKPPSPPESLYSSPASYTRQISIEPDMLPSHSNLQRLSPTQREAYSGPRPIHPMRLHRREVCDSYTGEPILHISDETVLKLSSQSLFQIHDAASAAIVGTVGFSPDCPSEVLAIHAGRDVLLRRDGGPAATRWCFKPSALPAKRGACWYWLRDRARGDSGVVLADAKKAGHVVARIQNDVLSFERPGLALDTVNEIAIAAIALAENARRAGGDDEVIVDLAAAIAAAAFGAGPLDHLDRATSVSKLSRVSSLAERGQKMRRRLTMMS